MTIAPNFPRCWGQPLPRAHQTSTLQADFDSCVRPNGRNESDNRETPPRVDAQKIRRAVERVIDLYLEIEYFGLQAAALDPDSRITGGATSPAPERYLKLWKSTVARVLASLEPEHRRALVDCGDHRRNEYEYGRSCARLKRLLDDPRRGTMKPALRREAAEALATDRAITEVIHDCRAKLERTKAYGTATLLFWIEVGDRDTRFPAEDIRRFIFEEVEKRKRQVS